MDRREAEGRTVRGLEAAVKGKKNDGREIYSGAGWRRVRKVRKEEVMKEQKRNREWN